MLVVAENSIIAYSMCVIPSVKKVEGLRRWFSRSNACCFEFLIGIPSTHIKA